jgi:hypothetical protein
MAHLEQLSGSGFRWTLKQANGDKNRVLWLISQVEAEGGYSREYTIAIARTPFDRLNRVFPGLEALTVEDLAKVLGKLKRQVLRRKSRVPATAENEPF